MTAVQMIPQDWRRRLEQKFSALVKTEGLGAAFRQGVHIALGMGADIIVNIDGDGQFNPKHIPKLIEPIIQWTGGYGYCKQVCRPEAGAEDALDKKVGQ